MKRIAKFEKVSYQQFREDFINTLKDFHSPMSEEVIKDVYDKIPIPKRATMGSAGYDFYMPINYIIEPGKTLAIPTGVRAKIDNGWVLKLYPRSGYGFKYRLQLDNTVGIIDSDYYNSDNEGHIFAKLTNDSRSDKIVKLKRGDAFMQGVFCEYGITTDDEANGIRNGGFGSTGGLNAEDN